jgi:hypothetical protein
MEWEDEETWLRGSVIRLRMLWRYAKDRVVQVGLKEFITEAERRLEALGNRRLKPLDREEPRGG